MRNKNLKITIYIKYDSKYYINYFNDFIIFFYIK